ERVGVVGQHVDRDLLALVGVTHLVGVGAGQRPGGGHHRDGELPRDGRVLAVGHGERDGDPRAARHGGLGLGEHGRPLRARGSPSGSTTTRARSSDASSPAATSSSAVPRTSGGWLRLARTSIGNVSTAVRPSGSSGPSPSVTSNVTDAGPTYSSSEV